MGQLEKQKAESRKTKRGSVNNDNRLAALRGDPEASKKDWGDCNPGWIAAIVVLMSNAGGAVRYGLSRDGGAYSVGLYLGSYNETVWFNGDVDIEAEMSLLYEKLKVIIGE